MNGAQDLGGMMGFGPIEAEDEAALFHAPWERRALGLTVAMGASGSWSVDASRHARESLDPADYLTSTYYEIWIKGLEKLMLAKGLIAPEELAGAKAVNPPAPIRRVLARKDVAAVLAAGSPCDRPASGPPAFAEGDVVRTRNINPAGHTRLPRYARAKTGIIEKARGVYVFPDTNAHGLGEQPQWLYTVAFTARELWGEDAARGDSVSIDAWESYLERA